MAASAAAGSGSPCGACKFLRRKCASDCVFAPYFCSEQGPARFAAIHKVFGASNVSKLLLHVPRRDRCEAVVTIAYEAQARIRDPVYGCVAHIFALQQQVVSLQAQLVQAKAQLAHNVAAANARSVGSSWQSGSAGVPPPQSYAARYAHPVSPPTSSLGRIAIEGATEAVQREMFFKGECSSPPGTKKMAMGDCSLGELEGLALRMMRN